MIIENFYEDPQSIVALANEFSRIGCGVGVKSPPLQEIDYTFYKRFEERIQDIFRPSFDYKLTTYFTKYEYNPIEQLNEYCAHIDGRNPNLCAVTPKTYNLKFCGQIFLSYDADPSTGITFYDPPSGWSIDECFDKALNNYLIPKNLYLSNKITLEEYTKMFEDYHKQFTVSSVVDNKFNRFVSWCAGTINRSRITKVPDTKIVHNFYIEQI